MLLLLHACVDRSVSASCRLGSIKRNCYAHNGHQLPIETALQEVHSSSIFEYIFGHVLKLQRFGNAHTTFNNFILLKLFGFFYPFLTLSLCSSADVFRYVIFTSTTFLLRCRKEFENADNFQLLFSRTANVHAYNISHLIILLWM